MVITCTGHLRSLKTIGTMVNGGRVTKSLFTIQKRGQVGAQLDNRLSSGTDGEVTAFPVEQRTDPSTIRHTQGRILYEFFRTTV